MKGKNYYVKKDRKYSGKKVSQDETDSAQLSSPVASGVQDEEVPPTSNGHVAALTFPDRNTKTNGQFLTI